MELAKLGHVPDNWKDVRVVLILKAGKPRITSPKYFRTFRQSSFLLKTPERLVNVQIKKQTNIDEECKARHAYLKGKSDESVQHETVKTIP